jgi:hypothetical protein
MESIRETQKKYGTRTMAVAIIIGLLFILTGYKPVGKGLVLGALFSVVNFVLMGETLPFKLGKSGAKTFFITIGSLIFRYAVLAVPLIVAIKLEQFNLLAVIIGVFMVQVTIMGDHLYKLISSTVQE